MNSVVSQKYNSQEERFNRTPLEVLSKCNTDEKFGRNASTKLLGALTIPSSLSNKLPSIHNDFSCKPVALARHNNLDKDQIVSRATQKATQNIAKISKL